MHIPTIDLASLTQPRSLERLNEACSEWGVFHLVGHGMPLEIREDLLEEMARFFARPTATKTEIERTEANPWGFYNCELTKNVEDWKEIFDVGPEEGTRVPQWPAQQPSFLRAVQAFYDASERIAKDLVRGIVQSLDASPHALDACFEDHTSYLRLNYYPLCKNPAAADAPTVPTHGRLGISHHSDAGAVTVLLQDGVSGLQVQRTGKWHDIEAERGALIINIGDMVQVWSNDRYKAPLHRVLADEHKVRFSAPFFLNPSYATHCAPLPSACGDKAPAYRPIHWGTFRDARAAGDYADVGEEVQIAHYRRRS